MQLNEQLLQVLKNFSKINRSIILKNGNVLRTISPKKTVLAKATLDVPIEGRAAIYDLDKFISIVSYLETPEIEFQENKFKIKSGDKTVSYTYAAEQMIISPPDKDLEMPSTDVVLNVSWEAIRDVIRMAGMLGFEDIAFIGDGSKVTLSAINVKDSTADKFDIVLDPNGTKVFSMVINVKNLEILPLDYVITLSTQGLAHFKGVDVEYWIALEADT